MHGNSWPREGCVQGEWKETDKLLSITKFAEKPNSAFAEKNLHIAGGSEPYYSLFGLYVLEPSIFAYIENSIRTENREKGEFQLTSCLDEQRQQEGFSGVVVMGRNFDIGMPEAPSGRLKWS